MTMKMSMTLLLCWTVQASSISYRAAGELTNAKSQQFWPNHRRHHPNPLQQIWCAAVSAVECVDRSSTGGRCGDGRSWIFGLGVRS